MTGVRYTALVLAGRRGGEEDPVAALGRCSHKCLIPIAGQAMLARVLRALAQSESVGAMAISIDDAAVLEGSAEIAALIERHDIALIASAATPSLSVARAIDVLGKPW
ncbi:MAG: NTP transferase domain-containing protein, partial [Proteobacteria bacterium]|nr:NTP transferase domain-containing protein [Pseudomonadota bacterium]